MIPRFTLSSHKEKPLIPQGLETKRVMGIEPTPPAWEAGVLPLNYTRNIYNLIKFFELNQVAARHDALDLQQSNVQIQKRILQLL